MYFEVTFSDGSTSIMQAHSRKQLVLALAQVEFTTTRVRVCKKCRKEIATVQSTFCAPCWDTILSELKEVWKDVPMSEQELQDLAMSYFVDG